MIEEFIRRCTRHLLAFGRLTEKDMVEIVGMPDLVRDGFIVEMKTKIEDNDITQMITYLNISGEDNGVIVDLHGDVKAWVQRI